MDVEKHQHSALADCCATLVLVAAERATRHWVHEGMLQRGRAAAPRAQPYQFSTRANTSGATMVASDSMMNFGVFTASLPQVIFSLGSAPEYEP